jgi:DNA-binding response OmpR family regulator
MAPSVLFVDDDVDTRVMVETALTHYHFEVVLASNYSEAIEAIMTRRFHIIILDNWMPEVTGIELCKKMRQLDDRTPVIFLSGAGRHDDKAEAVAAGADCYLTKPIDLDELVKCLNEWLTKDHHLAIKSGETVL